MTWALIMPAAQGTSTSSTTTKSMAATKKETQHRSQLLQMKIG
jgi:hypothetical protein